MGAEQGARPLTRARTVLALVAACAAAPAAAQRPELRADVIGPPPYAVTAGAGLVLPFGYYVRASADVAYGTRRVSGRTDDEWRGDLLARFLFDPFAQERWGLSIGGGLSFRRIPYLALVADVEGPSVHGIRAAVQAGVSGGWRFGLVLRRAIPDRR